MSNAKGSVVIKCVGERILLSRWDVLYVDNMLSLVPLFLLSLLGAVQEAPQHTFGTTVVSTSGFEGRIYLLKTGTSALPRLEGMKPAGSIYTTTLNVWPQSFDEAFPGITDRFEWFAIDYTGRIWIEQPGLYRFSLLSDDGARLFIDGQELIDNDGTHGAAAQSASAFLSRGIHNVHLPYFQGPRFIVALVLAIGAQGAPWRILDTNDFPPPKDPADWIEGTIGEIRHSVNYSGRPVNNRRRR